MACNQEGLAREDQQPDQPEYNAEQDLPHKRMTRHSHDARPQPRGEAQHQHRYGNYYQREKQQTQQGLASCPESGWLPYQFTFTILPGFIMFCGSTAFLITAISA